MKLIKGRVYLIPLLFDYVVKPRIDRSTLKSITIKVGRSHKWSVDVAGEPAPTMVWCWRDGIPLSNTARITIENRDYHTDFSIVDAVRKDAGVYTLVAENKSGKDTESVELTVLGWLRSCHDTFVKLIN